MRRLPCDMERIPFIGLNTCLMRDDFKSLARTLCCVRANILGENLRSQPSTNNSSKIHYHRIFLIIL